MAASRQPTLLDLLAQAQATPPSGPLAGLCRTVLPKGRLLSTPGQASDQTFIVSAGRLKVYLSGANRDLCLSHLLPGDLYTTHTPTYVQAITPSTVWMMDTRQFARQLAGHPAATPVLMRVLGGLLSSAVAQLEDLAFREVPARLARFLLGLAQRRGQAQGEAGTCLIPLDLGMEDLASLLGSTRQTVSVLINQWQREGLLQRQGRRQLLLLDLPALAQRAGHAAG